MYVRRWLRWAEGGIWRVTAGNGREKERPPRGGRSQGGIAPNSQAAIAVRFFRLRRQPSRPNAPSPPANNGRAAGRGVAAVIEILSAPSRTLAPRSSVIIVLQFPSHGKFAFKFSPAPNQRSNSGTVVKQETVHPTNSAKVIFPEELILKTSTTPNTKFGNLLTELS